MKFAYLIIAHTRFDQVAKLLELLDDERNDLYIHIDQKVSDAVDIFQKMLKPAVQKSKLYFVKQHNVMWGRESQIETELELLRAATKRKYDYYHLISGMDLPLKTQNEIHKFFEKHTGKEFVHFGSNEDARKRCQYYGLYQEDVFLGISTSGNSKNMLYVATTAHAKGMKVIGLTGAKNSKLEQMSDVCIKVPQTETYMIQELHLPVYHCSCLMLEEKFFGEGKK